MANSDEFGAGDRATAAGGDAEVADMDGAADDELRAWLVTRTKARIEALEELGYDDAEHTRERISALAGARNECKLLLEIDKHIGPLDREKIAKLVARAEEAAKKIHGGRPRRIPPPAPTGTPGITH